MQIDKVKWCTELQKGRAKDKPLYEQIQQQLIKQIQTGQLTSGDRLPSISKLVKKWQVDYQTVNLALKYMEKEGLIRCETGRGKGAVIITGGNCKYSMMFLRWGHDGFSLEITEGIRKYAEERKVRFAIADVSGAQHSLINTLASLTQGVDGIIVLPPENNIEFRKACLDALNRGTKIVFVDLKLDGLPISSVSIDHIGGAHQATKHLLNRHHNPVYCFGLTTCSSVQARYQGWALAMQESGFSNHSDFVYKTADADTAHNDFYELSLQNHTEAALKLLNKNSRISVFSCTGFAAQGLYRAAEEMGLKIGTDVFVAGFGDDPVCRKLPVPLSSIAQNNEEVGYEAANTLFMEMAGLTKHPMIRLLPAKFHIHKSSTG